MGGDVATNLTASDVGQIDTGPEPKPLVFLVVVKGEPVGQALVPDAAPEPRFPVVADVVIHQGEPGHSSGQDADLVAANGRTAKGDIPAALNQDANALAAVGVGGIGRPDQHRAGEVDFNAVTLDPNDRGIRGHRLEPVGRRPNDDALGDDQPRRQIDGVGRCRDYQKGCEEAKHAQMLLQDRVPGYTEPTRFR